jgi:DNA-directed RNA polymerase specialized sigma24 family protein
MTLDAPQPQKYPGPALAARTTHPIDDFLNDAQLHRVIRAILRSKGIPAGERADMTQEVLTELVAWCQRKGIENPAEIKAGARVIATNIGRKWWRDELRDRRHNVGLTGDADEHGPAHAASAVAKLDAQKIVAEIRSMVDHGTLSQRAAEVLLAIADETTLAEHAAETDQSAVAVRQAHSRAMAKLLRHLGQRGLGDIGLPKLLSAATIAASIAMILFLVVTGRLHIAGFEPVARHPHQEPKVVPSAGVDEQPAPPWSEIPEDVMVRTRENRELAARAVIEAEVAYKRMEWRVCLQDLAEARKLDKTVGDVPALQAECTLQEERAANSKGGPPPRRR